MRKPAPVVVIPVFLVVMAVVLWWLPATAQQPTFRNAPQSAAHEKNPYAGSASATTAGKTLYAKNCAQCHGRNRQGMGPAPALDSAKVQSANPGELYWFIGTGNPSSGMPSWSMLSKQQRWQLVTFLQAKP